MAFANPALLIAGMGMLLVPIIVHLIKQQKPRHLIFPALQFVQKRIQSNQSRLRFRHWLLLLMRCLGIFLIAASFAQPSSSSSTFGTWLILGALGLLAILLLFVLLSTLVLFRPINILFFAIVCTLFASVAISIGIIFFRSFDEEGEAMIGSDQSPVSAVLLIDNSPRMQFEMAGQGEGNEVNQSQSRLDASRTTAEWLVRQLPDGSNVSIVDASANEPFFCVDKAAAIKRISALTIKYLTVPIPERLENILRFLDQDSELGSLEPDQGLPREIYVFSDLSVESWRSKRRKEVQLKLADRAETSVYLVDVGVAEAANYRLDDLELLTDAISVGGSADIVARVIRQGPPGERPVELIIDKIDPRRPSQRDGVTLEPEQRLLRSAAVTLEENGSQELSFSVQGLPRGIHHGVVRLRGGDALKVDNQRYFTIAVRDPWSVLLVRPKKRDEIDSEVADRIINAVLSPEDLVEAGQAEYQCKTIDQEKLLEENLSNYAAIFLLDPRPLDSRGWKALARFAQNGGGVAVFLGENSKNGLSAEESFLSEAALSVLGGRLGEIWTPPETWFSNPDYNHPIFSRFKRFETENLWRDFPVYQHWGLLPLEADKSEIQTILGYSNQQAAIVDRRLGSGTVLTVTTPFTEPGTLTGRIRWNDVTTGEWWPTALLIDQIAEYLVSSEKNQLNYNVGDNVSLLDHDNQDNRDVLLYTPRNEEPTELQFQEEQLRYRFTETPGNYRMKTIGKGGGRRGFSVNLESRQTDLSRVSEMTLDETLGKGRFKLAKTKKEIVREQGYRREGKKFFSFLLTLFAIVVLLEFLMSNRFYRKV
ncbi:MAG: BatA domain-containing protein [Pirellulaceae bacterium]|nr:BatA domain-containing protein [Pirellulaceae bacterium]